MLNFKNRMVIIGTVSWLCSCKPAAQSFSYEYNVDTRFFRNSMKLAGISETQAKRIKVYRAELQERLVDQDAVPEYRLINVESDQPYVELKNRTRNHQFLYLFQLIPDKTADTVFVYMATGFTGTVCTSLGPVYVGRQDGNEILFKNVLRISELKKRDQPQEIKERAANGGTVRRYQIDDKKDTLNLIFRNENILPNEDDLTSAISIIKIIRDEPNKIGGTKAVIFTTEKIFEDPKALIFTYLMDVPAK